MPRLKVNGKALKLEPPDDMPPLWALRNTVNSSGIKYGRGTASCDARAVPLDGHPIRSSVTPVVGLAGKRGRKLLFTTANLA